MVGEQLGPYRIEAPIGEGGMGTVFRARDTRLDRTVAIKLSKTEFSDRFEREARAVASLNHPNICTLHDVGPNYLVMELVDGTPLNGPLPLDKAVEYAAQILDALDAAHRNGIVHRDLKPANILVTKRGIKLLDFGLAKQSLPLLRETDATRTQALTGNNELMGTLQYMAPEQLHGKEADVRSDLFAFGCLFFEMLTGRRAFEGETAAAIAAAILERQPALDDLPVPIQRVIAKCLAKDPDDRFQNARDLKTAILWAAEAQPEPAVRTASRRLPWIAPVIGLATGVLLAAAWIALHRPAEPAAYQLQIAPPGRSRFANTAGRVGDIALSPDGHTLAFIASTSGAPALWTRSLTTGEVKRLPDSDWSVQPFWSPDSQSIGFFASGKLFRIEAKGGAPQAICEVGSSAGGAWTSDGSIVFGRIASGLFRVPANGGNPVALTSLDRAKGQLYQYWPQVLPGDRLLYYMKTNSAGTTGVYGTSLSSPGQATLIQPSAANGLYAQGYLLSLRGASLFAQPFDPVHFRLSGETRRIAERVAWVTSHLAMTVAGNGIAVFAASGSEGEFVFLDRSGNRIARVGPPGAYQVFRLSPDLRFISFQREDESGTDLWLLNTERGATSRLTSGTPATLPVWSPDNRSLIVTRDGSLWRLDLAAGQPGLQLTKSSENQYAQDWSADGGSVLFRERNELWYLQLGPDGKPSGPPRPYLRTSFYSTNGRFSPEPHPRWVAYQSDETGRFEIYVQAFPEPRGKVQISTAGGVFAQWAPDGKELFFLSPDEKLMSVKLKTRGDTLDPSSPQALFSLPPLGGSSTYQVDRSGRFLVLASPDEIPPPLTVLVNWTSLLKSQ